MGGISEPLTDTMITALRDEAANAGDLDTIEECEMALGGMSGARADVAHMINWARAMDDSKPFVRVVADDYA